jgi:uncharacterized surface protein with fasciclin (FAS1) repeats
MLKNNMKPSSSSVIQMVGLNKMFATTALAALVLAFATPALAQGMLMAPPTMKPTMAPTMRPGMQGMASPTMAPGARGGMTAYMQMTTSDKGMWATISDMSAVGMNSMLMEGKDITMFVPDNAAIQKFGTDRMSTMMKDRQMAQNAMKGFIMSSVVMPSDLTDGKMLDMMNGQTMKVSMAYGQTMIDGARITKAIKTSNGMIYIIDSIPSSMMSMMQTGAAPASM